MTFDLGLRVLACVVFIGIAAWALLRPRASVAASFGAQFAHRSRAWVTPRDAAEVDAVLTADLRTRAVLVGVAGVVFALAWPVLEPGWTLLALGGLLAVSFQLMVELEVDAFRGWRCCTGLGEPAPVADFLGPVQRSVLWLAAPVAALPWISAGEVGTGCAVGAGTLGLAGYAWWQRRRVLRLRFDPRDDNQAYLVDAMRATLAERHLVFLAPVFVVVLVSTDVTTGWYAALVTAILAASFIGLFVELRRPPRFRRRRWPQLVEQQVVLDDGRPYPAIS